MRLEVAMLDPSGSYSMAFEVRIFQKFEAFCNYGNVIIRE